MKKYAIADAIIQDLKRKLDWYEKRYGPYIEKRGFNNWRNLFRKPTIQEWLVLFMLLMAGFGAWAYTEDVSACKDVLENLDGICVNYCSGQYTQSPDNFIITVDNYSFGES